MTDDEQQLKTLSIFYFIVGGLSAVGACLPFLHLALGIAIVTGNIPAGQSGMDMPTEVGWFFIGIAALIIVLGWAYALCMIIAGLRLRGRQAHVFCLVMASITCVSVPIGTCLGIFTIVVLARPSVKRSFEREKARASAWEDRNY